MDRFDRQLELADGIETEYLRILYYTFEKNYNDTYKSYEYKRLCTIVDGEKNISEDEKLKRTPHLEWKESPVP